MSNENNGARPVKTLKGLLKFCMEATKSEDASGPSQFNEMSEERKQWLEDAMSSMTVNVAEEVSKCLKTIEDAQVDTEEGTQQITGALTDLQDWVEDIDIAQDFITIKGLRVIPGLLNSEVSEVRWRCLELLANLCQNNPKTQAAVARARFLPPIVLMADSDPNPLVRLKALYALSCLSRSNLPVQRVLLSTEDGLSVVVRALGSEEEKIRIKASFMLSAMASDNPALRGALLEKDLVEQMIVCLQKDHCNSHEFLMSALATMADNHDEFKECCLQERFDLRSFLTKRIRFLTGKEEFEGERSHAERLLKALNTTSESSSSSSTPSSSRALMAV